MKKRVRFTVTVVSIEPVCSMVSGGYARSTRIESTMHVMRDELGRKLVWWATGDRRLEHGGEITAIVETDMYQSTRNDPYMVLKDVRLRRSSHNDSLNRDSTLYLRHRDGSTHRFGGRRLAALRREITAGRGGPEVARLAVEYVGFLGRDGETWDLESLDKHFAHEGSR